MRFGQQQQQQKNHAIRLLCAPKCVYEMQSFVVVVMRIYCFVWRFFVFCDVRACTCLRVYACALKGTETAHYKASLTHINSLRTHTIAHSRVTGIRQTIDSEPCSFFSHFVRYVSHFRFLLMENILHGSVFAAKIYFQNENTQRTERSRL